MKSRVFLNEHFIDQQDKEDKERITDTNFRITIRLFQYDAQLAPDDKMKYENMQKGAGDMMSGALIETGAGKLNNEANRETVIRMIKRGK